MKREQQEQLEPTPLQSVKDTCRRLRQEWEGAMQSADDIFSEVLSSLKAQEATLTAEQTEVQLLRRENRSLRKSVSQAKHEMNQKVLAEKKLAEEIKQTINNQLGQVKRLQYDLGTRLVRMRDAVEKIKNVKQLESTKAVHEFELSDNFIHGSLEQVESNTVLSNVLSDHGSTKVSCSTTSYPGRLNLEENKRLSMMKVAKATVSLPQKAFQKTFSRPKLEEVRTNGYTHWEKDLELRLKPTGSVSSASGSGPDKFQVDCVSIKIEFDEEAAAYIEDKSDQKSRCNGASGEEGTDILDNIKLSERLEDLLQNLLNKKCFEEDQWAKTNLCPPKKQKLLSLGRNSDTGKRKWDVPIEIALEEDAPGLLEKLQERGLLDGITIFGALYEDDGQSAELFEDMECIVKKIWGNPVGIKLPHVIRQHISGLGKGPIYSLSCLASLIDQAKSIRQRNWPVEWGWCRELQAFIFVFDKHNRVVLERPEYGNATYFFELAQFLPVKWQVFRLIHVLSVTAFGKSALLENKPLEVGYELTEEESKILEGFGWTAGTGLGSFLNFCDRVVHDVKEDYNVEWRQKIGKCLMDGYDKGRIMTPTLPAKFQKAFKTDDFEADIKSDILLTT